MTLTELMAALRRAGFSSAVSGTFADTRADGLTEAELRLARRMYALCRKRERTMRELEAATRQRSVLRPLIWMLTRGWLVERRLHGHQWAYRTLS